MKQYIIKQDIMRQTATFPWSCVPALRKQRSNKHELELQWTYSSQLLKNRYLQQQNSTVMAKIDELSLDLCNIKKETDYIVQIILL